MRHRRHRRHRCHRHPPSVECETGRPAGRVVASGPALVPVLGRDIRPALAFRRVGKRRRTGSPTEPDMLSIGALTLALAADRHRGKVSSRRNRGGCEADGGRRRGAEGQAKTMLRSLRRRESGRKGRRSPQDTGHPLPGIGVRRGQTRRPGHEEPATWSSSASASWRPRGRRKASDRPRLRARWRRRSSGCSAAPGSWRPRGVTRWSAKGAGTISTGWSRRPGRVQESLRRDAAD